MAIKVSTNFDVNAALPIDSRTVADSLSALSDITAPYEGMITYIKGTGVFSYYMDGGWRRIRTPYTLDVTGVSASGNTYYAYQRGKHGTSRVIDVVGTPAESLESMVLISLLNDTDWLWISGTEFVVTNYTESSFSVETDRSGGVDVVKPGEIVIYQSSTGEGVERSRSYSLEPDADDVGAIASSEKGAAGGVAELDSSGKVPSAQLPSYVDDVIEGYYSSGSFYEDSGLTTSITGETGKIYVDMSTNKTYRHSGSRFIEISSSLALGETSSTAYRGDRGKIAYDKAHTHDNKDVLDGITSTDVNEWDSKLSFLEEPKRGGNVVVVYDPATVADSGVAISDIKEAITKADSLTARVTALEDNVATDDEVSEMLSEIFA